MRGDIGHPNDCNCRDCVVMEQVGRDFEKMTLKAAHARLNPREYVSFLQRAVIMACKEFGIDFADLLKQLAAESIAAKKQEDGELN